ncbi:hypothetical protein [Piscirickettsia litoralis]|uniref:hypothetical protein n=1 Tax=Piscirickettsia litoralis TaxID=1891921 RepID=UPI000B2D0D78|nr:hypothetical protein [Piscirickettsia litoralis]
MKTILILAVFLIYLCLVVVFETYGVAIWLRVAIAIIAGLIIWLIAKKVNNPPRNNGR